MNLANMDPNFVAAIIVVIFFGIGLHEYAHCKFADMAGDPTPRIYGRVTLNLFKHFELFGTIMMFVTALSGIGIGWGKPAPMNAAKMRNPRWDLFTAVAAGPVSNLLQALVYGIFARVLQNMGMFHAGPGGGPVGFLTWLAVVGVFTNLGLACFNLIPIAPLDGHWLVGQLLPDRTRDRWYLVSRQYGPPLLLILVIGGQLMNYSIIGALIDPVVDPLAAILLGAK